MTMVLINDYEMTFTTDKDTSITVVTQLCHNEVNNHISGR